MCSVQGCTFRPHYLSVPSLLDGQCRWPDHANFQVSGLVTDLSETPPDQSPSHRISTLGGAPTPPVQYGE